MSLCVAAQARGIRTATRQPDTHAQLHTDKHRANLTYTIHNIGVVSLHITVHPSKALEDTCIGEVLAVGFRTELSALGRRRAKQRV